MQDNCCESGYNFPTSIDGDDSRQWVTRCDTCGRFESDEAAAIQCAKDHGAVELLEVHENPNSDFSAKAYAITL